MKNSRDEDDGQSEADSPSALHTLTVLLRRLDTPTAETVARRLDRRN
jgi:hypothetical protein